MPRRNTNPPNIRKIVSSHRISQTPVSCEARTRGSGEVLLVCTKGTFFPLLLNRTREAIALCGFQHHKGENLFCFLFSGTIIVGLIEILQATPPKLRRELGMCGNAAIIVPVQQQYYKSTRTYSSLVQPRSKFSIPGTWYLVHTSTSRLQDERYGGLLRAGNSL